MSFISNFNSHAHVERDAIKINTCTDYFTFQLTRSRGAWPSGISHLTFCNAISTHTLTWSVTLKRVKYCWALKFQLTRSRGAWRELLYVATSPLSNFNSHAHVERDVYIPIRWLILLEFQLTRSRGAWLSNLYIILCLRHFNSHAHVERDQRCTPLRACLLYFNSHAHVERDLRADNMNLSSYWFQLTRSRGAWQSEIIPVSVCDAFQLTRSRGAWLNRGYLVFRLIYFNSHAHVERDDTYGKCYAIVTISTHTLTWSVTSSSISIPQFGIFQLTRSRGAWPGIWKWL